MVLFSNVKPALCMCVRRVVPSVGSSQPSVISSVFSGAVVVSLEKQNALLIWSLGVNLTL